MVVAIQYRSYKISACATKIGSQNKLIFPEALK